MKKANLKYLSLLLAATLMTAVAGCATQAPTANSGAGASPAATTAASPANQQGQTNVRVQLSFLTQSLDAPLIVAIDKGYFAEEGLNVSYERGFGNADTISKLGSGNFDIAFSDMYNALEFNQKNPNSKVMAVAITQNAAPFAIVTLKDSGINSPQDLAGKEIGAPAGDGPRKLFPLFAQEVGIDPNSVKWVTMDPKLRESFLLQGQVPAVSGFATSVLPSLYKAGRSPDDINVFYYNENGLDFYGNAILTRAAFAEQNPEAVRGFIRAYMRGLQDVLKDPNAGLDAVIAADQSKLMDRTAEKARLQIALERMFITPEVEKNGLGGVDTARLEKSLQQTAEGFGLQGTPQVSDVFTDEFLPPAADRQLPPASERKPLS
ncbi:ABC transporter substrate-binding protein [Microcoleus sp. FACHB-1515]|uniref:ABC transporter substrate-binding protein n=1 Tax=Cyanophyceae TaxID=3028117 RepID=UPI001A7EE3F2|nr:ABC transporter substrate-binding protein [Microcoleus sp. FACHB-1515]